jgi:hypothetical protein
MENINFKSVICYLSTLINIMIAHESRHMQLFVEFISINKISCAKIYVISVHNYVMNEAGCNK